MKKAWIIILSLALALSLAACGGGGGSKTSSESPSPAESVNPPSSKAEADEIRYYGIGEAAEANGLSIKLSAQMMKPAVPISTTAILFAGRQARLILRAQNLYSPQTEHHSEPLCEIIIIKSGVP